MSTVSSHRVMNISAGNSLDNHGVLPSYLASYLLANHMQGRL